MSSWTTETAQTTEHKVEQQMMIKLHNIGYCFSYLYHGQENENKPMVANNAPQAPALQNKITNYIFGFIFCNLYVNIVNNYRWGIYWSVKKPISIF